MFVLGNLIKAIAVVLNIALSVFMWVVIARAVLSWVSPDPFNPVVRFIHNVTEPVLRPVRSRVPGIQGLDISPIIVFLIIIFLQYFLVASLDGIARSLLN